MLDEMSSDGQKHGRARLVLVLGGARSGKSAFAERLAQRSERSVAFIATATSSDEDMQARIARHRADRPVDWQTLEEPLKLADAVAQAATHADVLLLDCLTIWLSNWLLEQGEMQDEELLAGSARFNDSALAEVDRLLKLVCSLPASKTIIAVTNEVGLGIVPAYALGRIYRDVLGRVNQRVAAQCDRVYLMVAGLGVDIKRLHEEANL